MTTHEQLVALFETYVLENKKFTEKNIKASAAKARKALSELRKALKVRRIEITEEKIKLIELLAKEAASKPALK